LPQSGGTDHGWDVPQGSVSPGARRLLQRLLLPNMGTGPPTIPSNSSKSRKGPDNRQQARWRIGRHQDYLGDRCRECPDYLEQVLQAAWTHRAV
jgi:hypothetical protein